mgnify:CR=1 FL=1
MEILLLIIGLAVGAVIGWLVSGMSKSKLANECEQLKATLESSKAETERRLTEKEDNCQKILAAEKENAQSLINEIKANAQEQVAAANEQIEKERKHAEELRNENDKQWNDKFEAMKQEIEKKSTEQLLNKQRELQYTNRTQFDELMKPIKEQFEAFQKSIEEAKNKNEMNKKEITTSFENTLKSFQEHQDMTVKHLNEQTERIGNDANNLTKALMGESKTQGDWGEMILETMLENSGLRKDEEYFVQENVKNEDGNLGYEVSYTYTNKYGNSATQSVFIVLDQVPPKVEILFPLEGDVIYSNFVDVKWTVDIGDGRGAVVQDTLITQGLVKGGNAIVRFYRDKAGNEASDTVRVIMKNAKDVDIAIEQAVTEITKDKVAEYYATHEPAEGETYAVTIYNSKTEKEVETLVGGGYKTKTGSGEEPYPGLPGHLGPTLGIETKVPTINAVGGLATLDDIVGSDGLVPLEGVDAEESEKVTVEEYVQQYCSTEFAENVGADLSKANLYSTKMYVKIWIYTSLGQFADYYAFTQDLNNPEYVNDAGLLTLYFEMKPDKDGNVRSETGRLYATGAYVFRTEVEMKSTLRCSLPPFVKTSGGMEPEKPTNKVGSARTVKEDLLKSFGYKRPNMK